MPSLKALRKRIASVRSTQQITKAMKMVAAAKLRRAQEAAERARPYTGKLAEMFAAVAAELGEEAHPLLARRDERRADLLVITSDRGLCGGYNANLLRMAQGFAAEREGVQVSLLVTGRKGIDFYKRRAIRLLAERQNVMASPAPDIARELAGMLTTRFADGENDAVYVLCSRFRSAISQVPTLTPLLPVARPDGGAAPVDYIFEPPRAELLAQLLPRYVEAILLQAILESIASEHGSRMTAMDNATNNAADMIDRLTLSMNRARQATITTELMEIVSGAEALKG
jgi:F-type H+-transporting ATPase subunit gamma